MNFRRILGWATSQDQTIPAEVRRSRDTRAYTVPGITDLATRNILR